MVATCSTSVDREIPTTGQIIGGMPIDGVGTKATPAPRCQEQTSEPAPQLILQGHKTLMGQAPTSKSHLGSLTWRLMILRKLILGLPSSAKLWLTYNNSWETL
uniref:Uncharacterized protein n=1 Tax=Cannabis sativa TaxID=3483 RepID=A0A803NRG0_CANSA